MKRPPDGKPLLCSDAKRAQVERRLVANGAVSKSAIARLLATLKAEGLLADGMVTSSSANETRKHVGKSVGDVASTVTPYGPIVQQMVLPCAPPQSPFVWDYIHPMAFVYYLSTISDAFGRLMSNIIADGKPLRIVVYVDAFRPGNVLRPDAGRSTENIFWAIAGWPQWLLRRADAWLTFGCIRSKIVATLPGGSSALMQHVLHQFFGEEGSPSFSSGVTIANGGGGAVLLQATFGGFLGDEKGLKDCVLA